METGFGLRLGAARRRPAGAVAPLDPLAAHLVAAYGLRRLVSIHSGPCLRVRRATDDGEADIGFRGGWIDGAALLAFVGAGSGHVVTWYDQSGSGLDATQEVAADQPRIVAEGVPETAPNGRPWIAYGGTATLPTAASALLPKAAESSTALIVGRAANEVADGARRLALFWGTPGGNGETRDVDVAYLPGSNPECRVYFNGAAAAPADWNGAIRSVAARHETLSGTQTRLRIDADGTGAQMTGDFQMATPSPTQLFVGGCPGPWIEAWRGFLGEVAVFSAALSDAEVARLRAGHRSAWGTP